VEFCPKEKVEEAGLLGRGIEAGFEEGDGPKGKLGAALGVLRVLGFLDCRKLNILLLVV